MQGDVAQAQAQPDLPANGAQAKRQAQPGKALALGFALAMAAMFLSSESITMVAVVRAKFFPFSLPEIYAPLGTNLTPQEHLAGLVACILCLGGAYCAGRSAARLAPDAEFRVGVPIFIACASVYASTHSGQPFILTPYGALNVLLFPVFLFGGVWVGKRENRLNAPAMHLPDRARPWLALACAVFAQWLLPMLVLHAYAHLTTDTHDQLWYADEGFYKARAAFGHLGMIAVEAAASILGGYLCARLARHTLIAVGPVLLVVLGFPVLKAAVNPVMQTIVRGETIHLGLLLLGLAAGLAHNLFTKPAGGDLPA